MELNWRENAVNDQQIAGNLKKIEVKLMMEQKLQKHFFLFDKNP